MKSTISENPNADAKPYPKLMHYVDNRDRNGMVLLMVSETDGTVVYASEGVSYVLGYYASSWDPAGLVDFTGTVTLSND
jgi:hypothetical protein